MTNSIGNNGALFQGIYLKAAVYFKAGTCVLIITFIIKATQNILARVYYCGINLNGNLVPISIQCRSKFETITKD